MNKLWSDKRIFLIGGPGGVGKTTVAASLGLRLATEGYKTVVLTVDPAKRLAQALGFTHFSSDLQKVEWKKHPKAELYASMLDPQHYFDRIISRFATSDAQREKILNNRVYRTMVESLGGSHEYAAMERLLEFAKETDFDKIIVDTPPSQNAVDLLNAPQKLADFMDNSVLRWFQHTKPHYFSVFKQGTKVAMKLLEKIFGTEFFATLAGALDDLDGMQAGFRSRNLEVLSLLRSEATGFFLVTYPSEVRYQESVYFLRVLKDNQIPLSGIVLNRLEQAVPSNLESATTLPEPARTELLALLKFQGLVHGQQAVWQKKFLELLPDRPSFLLPKQDAEIHDLEILHGMGSQLVF